MEGVLEAVGSDVGAAAYGEVRARIAGFVRSLPARSVALLRHEARRLVLPLAVLSAVSWIGTAAAPSLEAKPLLLVALSPRLAFLTLAAHKVGLVPFLVVGMLRLTVADPFNFLLGRRHGASLAERITRRVRPLAAVHAGAARCIPLLVFLRPNGTNLALAGAARTRVLVVVAADLVGTAAYLVLVHQVGRAFV
ncbi:MAG TPA: hypothetical protein VHN98_02975 [Acidimicrobiales bacterium]|nr:hypothetical protein [Acidimicrobiales bacterium]